MPTHLARAAAALIALPLLVAACAGTESLSDEGVDAQGDAIVSENANDKIAFDYFVGKGLSAVQAAGIVGNFDQESGMSPTIAQYGGGPGRGIAQWSAGGRWDHDSHDNVAWYASTKGKSKYALDLQLEFTWYELTSLGYGYSHLRAATTVTGAVEAFQDEFEICGTCASSNRIAHAQAALDAFGHDGSSGSGGGGCVVGGFYCGGDKVHGDADTLYRCTGGSSGVVEEHCSNGCSVNSGEDDSCAAGGPSGGGCVDGGLYCGGDKVHGDPDTLYRCNGASAPTVVSSCGNGCRVNPGDDDACGGGGSCVVGGYYCGGDKVSGSSSTLYRCTGGSSGAVVSHCAHGCQVRPGDDDRCE